MELRSKQIASIVDHTLLRSDASPQRLQEFLDEAQELGVFGVCVFPILVSSVRKRVSLPVVTVCGFPSGCHLTAVKCLEAEKALQDGADEIDVVVTLSDVFGGEYGKIRDELGQLREICGQKVLKVIVESAALTEQQRDAVCLVVQEAKADFVKTSTGFHPAGGADAAHVAQMHKLLCGKTKIKASGGIRTAEQAIKMIQAGAARLGLSATREILSDCI